MFYDSDVECYYFNDFINYGWDFNFRYVLYSNIEVLFFYNFPHLDVESNKNLMIFMFLTLNLMIFYYFNVSDIESHYFHFFHDSDIDFFNFHDFHYVEVES